MGRSTLDHCGGRLAAQRMGERGNVLPHHGHRQEVLKIGGISVSEYLHQPSYETILGDTGGAITVTGTIEVPGGVFSAFSVISDTAGAAASVPEPASALLAAGGLACLALRRRWR